MAQRWLGQVVDSARKVLGGDGAALQPALYNGLARYQLGFELTTWPMLKSMGFADEPSYYDEMNSLDRLGAKTRAERLTVGHSSSTCATRPFASFESTNRTSLPEKRTRKSWI